MEVKWKLEGYIGFILAACKLHRAGHALCGRERDRCRGGSSSKAQSVSLHFSHPALFPAQERSMGYEDVFAENRQVASEPF